MDFRLRELMPPLTAIDAEELKETLCLPNNYTKIDLAKYCSYLREEGKMSDNDISELCEMLYPAAVDNTLKMLARNITKLIQNYIIEFNSRLNYYPISFDMPPLQDLIASLNEEFFGYEIDYTVTNSLAYRFVIQIMVVDKLSKKSVVSEIQA